jgi:hypothetical protein
MQLQNAQVSANGRHVPVKQMLNYPAATMKFEHSGIWAIQRDRRAGVCGRQAGITRLKIS